MWTIASLFWQNFQCLEQQLTQNLYFSWSQKILDTGNYAILLQKLDITAYKYWTPVISNFFKQHPICWEYTCKIRWKALRRRDSHLRHQITCQPPPCTATRPSASIVERTSQETQAIIVAGAICYIIFTTRFILHLLATRLAGVKFMFGQEFTLLVDVRRHTPSKYCNLNIDCC